MYIRLTDSLNSDTGYLRLSYEGRDVWYVRDTGYCYHISTSELLKTMEIDYPRHYQWFNVIANRL
jgi:hypothetical protein